MCNELASVVKTDILLTHQGLCLCSVTKSLGSVDLTFNDFIFDQHVSICTMTMQENCTLSLPQINCQGGLLICNTGDMRSQATEFVTGDLRSLVISAVSLNKSKAMQIERTLTYYSCEYKPCARSSAVMKICGLLFGAVCHSSLQKTGQIPSIFPGLLQEYSQGQV